MKSIYIILFSSVYFSLQFFFTPGLIKTEKPPKLLKQNDNFIIGDWALYKQVEICVRNCEANGNTVIAVVFPIPQELYHRYIFNSDSTYNYIVANDHIKSSGYWSFSDYKKSINMKPLENIPGTVNEYKIKKITKDTLELSFGMLESVFTNVYIHNK